MALAQLEDFMVTYPSIDDPNIQGKISVKYEFAELASSPNDPPPPKGKYYKHQELIQRYATVYPRQIIISETGTGKSYLAGALETAFRKLREHKRTIKHIIILVAGPNQKLAMMDTLIWKSTGGHYITQGLLDADNSQKTSNNATRALGDDFTITTYGMFTSRLIKMSDEQIRRAYSDHLIIIDEIHNLRLERPENEEEVTVGLLKKKRYKKDDVYDQIFRLTHIPDRIKVVGMTASVIINNVSEFRSISNLILPEDRLFTDDDDIASMTIEELATHVNGMVSYVRALDTGIRLDRIGTPVDETHTYRNYTFESQLVLDEVVMAPHQTLAYLIAKYFVNRSSAVVFQSDPRAASSWVYPDGSWGKASFERYYKPTKDGWYEPIPELLEYFTPDKIGLLSAKDERIYNLIMETDGVVVIYDHNIHGGIYDLAIALTYMGFQRFTETESVFTTKEGDDRRIKSTFRETPRIAIFDEKKITSNILDIAMSYDNRYGGYIKVFIITDATKEGISIGNMERFIHRSGVFNPADTHQAESRGIRSDSHIFLIEEEIGRLMDEKGLTRLEAKKQATFKIKTHYLSAVPGNIEPEEDDEVFDDDVIEDDVNYSFLFRKMEEYTRTMPGIKNFIETKMSFSFVKPKKDLAEFLSSLFESNDKRLYLDAEGKNIEAKTFVRKLKKLAFDCNIHHDRNVRIGNDGKPTDKDFSPECDYDECNYRCYQGKPVNEMSEDEFDYSTYDIYYKDEVIERLTDNIRVYFSKNTTGTVEGITEVLLRSSKRHIRQKYVSIALTNIVIEKIPLRDRFGFTSYLRRDGNIYYLTRDFPTNETVDSLSLSYYSSVLVGKTHIELEDLYRVMLSGITPTIWEKLANVPIIDDKRQYRLNLNEILVNERVETQIDIVERAVVEHERGNDHPMLREIMHIYSKVLISMIEPRTMIDRRTKILQEKTAQKSAKEVSGKPARGAPKKIELIVDKNGELVYFHSMLSHIPEKSNFRAVHRIPSVDGGVMLFKPSEGLGWRKANPVENLVYVDFVKDNLAKILTPLESNNIYGIISLDGIFRLRDKTLEEKGNDDNKKKKRRGRECVTNSPGDLRNYLWKLGIRDYPSAWNPDILNDYTREEMMKNILVDTEKDIVKEVKKWDEERFMFYFAWSIHKSEKGEMCQLIQHKLNEDGILLNWRNL